MDYRRFGNTYLVRMDVGEEIIEQLKSLCRSENIRLAQVDAIGAVRQAIIGVYNLEEQAYLADNAEILHTQGKNYILDSIDGYMKNHP